MDTLDLRFTVATLAMLELVQEAAGNRFDELEIHVMPTAVFVTELAGR